MSYQYNDEAFVTLATTDNYAIGALTLARALRRVNTTRALCVMVTSDISDSFLSQLREAFNSVVNVDVFDSNDSVNLALLKRPELGVTFTKVHCWRLTQYNKCVFLDADTLPLSNVDELFEREEFSAAADAGWSDCFNSGVFVFRPSQDTYASLVAFALNQGSFDGGDQGLLNLFFNSWSTSEASRRLPFVYNMTINASYSYAPAYNQFKDLVKIVHFIGAQKPWYSTYNLDTRSVVGAGGAGSAEHLNAWWAVFADDVLPRLDSELRARVGVQLQGSHAASGAAAGSVSFHAFQPASSSVESSSAPQYVTGSVSSGGVVVGSDQHQNLWEHGQIEYTGRDSFSNIQAHLDAQLQKK